MRLVFSISVLLWHVSTSVRSFKNGRVRPAPSSPHRGRADFRAGHGDQFGRRGGRPKQANRDQSGEADPSYATHFHPSSWQDGGSHIFRRPNVKWLTLRGALTAVIKLRPARAAPAEPAGALFGPQRRLASSSVMPHEARNLSLAFSKRRGARSTRGTKRCRTAGEF